MIQQTKLDREAAAAVARMTAGSGMDRDEAYQAARAAFGTTPDVRLVDEEIRRWFALFSPDAHARDLRKKRLAALFVMKQLADWHPLLTGAVLSGAATASEIPELLLTGNEKELELHFLSRRVPFEVVASETAGRRESVTFLTTAMGIDILITVSTQHRMPRAGIPDTLQHPAEAAGKAGIKVLEALLLETNNED